MLVHEKKNTRAESARMNGAKSTGPKTPEGLFRSQTARYKHGLYSTRAFLLPGESVEEFTELQTQLRAYWQPVGFYDQTTVEQLAGNLWETFRLQAAKNDHIHDVRAAIAQSAPKLRDDAKLNLMAENRASTDGGTIERNQARQNFLSRQRDQIGAQPPPPGAPGRDQRINPNDAGVYTASLRYFFSSACQCLLPTASSLSMNVARRCSITFVSPSRRRTSNTSLTAKIAARWVCDG